MFPDLAEEREETARANTLPARFAKKSRKVRQANRGTFAPFADLPWRSLRLKSFSVPAKELA